MTKKELHEKLIKENPENLSAINWLHGKYLGNGSISLDEFETAYLIYMEQIEDAYLIGFDEAQDGQHLNFKRFCENYF